MKPKKIPKVVLLYLGLIGFHIGSVFSVLLLALVGTFNLLGALIIYTIGWALAVLLTWLIAWRYQETIEIWLPFLKEKKKK